MAGRLAEAILTRTVQCYSRFTAADEQTRYRGEKLVSECVISSYQNLPASYHEYDPRSAEVAEMVARQITSRLSEVTAEHVGSTAVPGCGGKGIVDLMLLYQPGRLQAAKDTLDVLGFQRQTGRDPFPEERPMRVGSLQHAGKTFRFHVHVVAENSDEVRVLRSFRDRLRSDPELRAAYVACKRSILAAGVTDSLDYCEMKGIFIADWLQSHPPRC